MRLINVEAFLGREELIKSGKELNRRTSVFAFRDDEATDYAILSHRWMSMEHEVDYDEMNDLAKMDKGEIAEVCRRDGYRKILDSCEQAKRDRYKWLWIDTCCIDKRSSAELSEAINSMFRWYENSRVCYAYFHDLTGKSFPTARDVERYPNFNGWPEWFSRGWTLQEMIAPSDVRFFNKNWQPIGDKMTLAHTLAEITRVPEDILRYGLPVIRPCVAQILSWAADRVTTRVEDRAYSLLGLLDVNMPMLYGEGKKAFRRLQLEIIRISNDQSIFAWDYQGEKGRTCSILADDPSFFRNCSEMELIHDLDKFKQMHKNDMEEPPSKDINDDQFGVFPITNRGIQILLLLRCLDDFDSVFEARLPCCSSPSGPSVTIKLISSKRNYYRHFTSVESEVSRERTLRFKNVTLRYQDMLCSATFEIDDNGMTKRGFNYCGTYRASRLAEKLAEKTIMLTNTDPLCVEVYSDHQANLHLAVGYGEFFGQHWIHLNCEVSAGQSSWKDYAEEQYMKMLDSGQTYAKHMIDACPRNERYHRLLVKHTSLPGSARTVQTCCVTWKSSKTCTVKINVFHGFCRVPVNKWVGFDTDGTWSNCDMQSLMIHDNQIGQQHSYPLLVDGVSMKFTPVHNAIKLGDYGHFTKSKHFYCEGNILTDFKLNCPKADFTPRKHKIHEIDGRNTHAGYVTTLNNMLDNDSFILCEPIGLSLPNHSDFCSFLTSVSTQLVNQYLVVRVIQCSPEHSGKLTHAVGSYKSSSMPILSSSMDLYMPLCTIMQPFSWY